MAPQAPAIGEEVSVDAPKVGEDVSHLMAAPAAPSRTGSRTAMAIAAAANAAPTIGRALEEVATNPGVPKAGSTIGQVVGGIQGAMRSPLDAAGGSWAGGKAGWFTGKLVQKLSAPVATALEKAAPLLKEIGPLLGAFGAEGEALQTLNSPESLMQFAKGATPDQQVKLAHLLVDTKKMTPSEAIHVASAGDPAKFGPLMTAFLTSKAPR